MARMLRTLFAPAFVALLVVSGSTTAQAAFATGTQGMADNGSPSINSTQLSTATTFTFGTPFVTTTSETGDFRAVAGNSGLTLTTSVLNLAAPTAFRVSNAAFGTFTSSSVVQLFSSVLPNAQVRAFYVLGSFTGGTNFGGGSTSTPASFTVSFTESTIGGVSSFSDSSTLSIPPAPASVPEPASVAMLGLGLVGSIGFAARRRLARA